MTTFRFTTAGESHGPGLVAIVEGMPAGLELDREALDRDMARRQLGHGRGGRMKIETDTVEVRSGVRHGRTLGSPIALLVANRDYANWEERMNPWPVEGFSPDEVHLPRPGHADLVGAQKYGHADIRNVLERASARETAARVAAGTIARGFLSALGVEIHSHVLQIASVRAAGARRPEAGGLRRGRRRPGPLPRPGGQQGDGRGDQPPAQGQREPRRQLRGAELRPRPRDRLPHLLGRPARRAPGRRRRLDPVGQGRRDRRSLGRRRPPRLGGARRDLLVARRTATSAKPTTPAASRAG